MTTLINARAAVKNRFGAKQNILLSWPAYLGNEDGTVTTTGNNVYVRYPTVTSSAVEVYNGGVPAVAGLRVMVGYRAETPTRLEALGTADIRLETQVTPPSGTLGPHGPQHGWSGGDAVYINWRQITPLGVYPTDPASLSVQIMQGVIPRPGVDVNVTAQTVDLTASVPATTGARYTLISYDSTGAVVATDGTINTGGFGALTIADIPATPAGNWRSAAIALYYGQTAIVETYSEIDIWDLRFPEETTAGSIAPSAISGATAQYQYLTVGASPTFTPAWSSGLLNIATAKTLTVNNTLTLAGTSDGFTLTVPATGTVLFRDANIAAGRVAFGLDANILTGEAAFTWDSTGKRLLIGSDLGVAASAELYKSRIADTTVDDYGLYLNYTSTATQTGNVYGHGNFVNAIYSSNGGGNVIGVNNQASKAGTGTLAYIAANQSIVSNSGTGTITQALGYYVDHSFTGNATITETSGYYDILGFGGGAAGTVVSYKGFHFATPQMGGGAITTQYAFYAEPVTGATNNYAYYSNAGLNRFGDQLSIIGSADRIQLIVKGNGTQTTNLQEWQNSSSTPVASMSNLGYGFAARYTLGTDVGVVTPLQIFLGYGADQAADRYGTYINHYTNSAQSGAFYSLGVFAGANNASGTVVVSQGIYGQSSKSGAGAITSLYGIGFSASNSGTGGIAVMRGAAIDVGSSGAAAISEATGVHVTFNVSSGTITTAYGLYVGDVPTATNRYAIYTNVGVVRFGDVASINLNNATTAAVDTVLTLAHNTSGTAANGFGSRQLITLESSTTADTNAAALDVSWVDATHASRKAKLSISVWDTAERAAFSVSADGSQPLTRIGDGGTTNYTQFDGDGDLTQVGTARIDWTKITAASVSITNGTLTGTVTNLQTAFDGSFLVVNEAAGAPGQDLIVDFTSVVAFNWVNIIAVYDGTGTHGIAIQLYDWVNARWDTFDALQTGAFDVSTASGYVLGNHDFFVPSDTNYIGTGGSAGQVRVRFYHTMTGNASHKTYIDVVALQH